MRKLCFFSSSNQFRAISSVAFVLVIFVLLITLPVSAQSPNTGSIVVVVADQTDAVVKGAKVAVVNSATGATREAVSGTDGSVTIPALSLTGTYKVAISKEGFGTEERNDITLRSGETATLRVKLVVGTEKAAVTVYGTTEGVRADPQIGRRVDSPLIDETPLLGRKLSSLPLLNAAYRQAKGTGDLFVNQTYFTTGAGSRRTTTFTLDGANNDEAWGRQTAIATVPIGAVQEMTVLSNSFSSEFGWTAGSAINVVTKSGTNSLHGEGIFMARPGNGQPDMFSKRNYCPPSVKSCVTPDSLVGIRPVDIPDSLKQVSASIGGPLIKDKTFFFLAGDYTWQNRTTYLAGGPTGLPAFVLPADGHLDYTGHYRQGLFDGRLDHKFTPNETFMLRFNMDRFHDDNPQDAVGGTSAPSVARRYSRRSWTTQANLTSTFTTHLINEARFAYLNGDPVTHWDAPVISTTYTRSGTVPFTIGQSRFSDLFGRQAQFSDTLSWLHGRHYLRFGGSLLHHTSGGTGSEPGTPILGTFTFKNTTTAPFDQLTLADVQSYSQPINFGISSYELTQWLYTGFVQDHIRIRNDLTIDVGLRYDRQDLTTATKNFAPRAGFGWNPGGNSRLAIRGGYAMYYTQIRSNAIASYLVNGLDGLTTYTATSGQPGFPTCLVGSCLPVLFSPDPSTLPARDITIRAGQRDFYTEQFARYGLDFSKVPNYPDEFVNPRSQVMSIGAEYEIAKGLFAGADYVHQHWTNLDRTVDLNAPSVFDRTTVGQTRTVAVANATRPIVPVVGGVRQINVLTNLGVADYDGLQTQVNYRGNAKLYVAFSYTLAKATNTTEPDGNGIGPDQSNIARLGEVERGPSVLDQRHRAVIMATYLLPYNFTIGTLSQFASARPFNATTGVDNNGDGANNDRPVVNGNVISKSAFRGTMTSDVGVFVENRIKMTERMSVLLRAECFNLFNHGNYLGRGITTYGNGATADPAFGRLVALSSATAQYAIPAFANVDPPRMFQLQARFIF